MKQQSNKEVSELRKRLMMQLLDILVVFIDIVIFILSWVLLSDSATFAFTFHEQLPWYLLIGYVVIFIVSARLLDSFETGKRRVLENTFGLCVASIISAALFYVGISIAFVTWYPIYFLIVAVILQIIMNTAYAFHANKLYFKLNDRLKALAIYSTKAGLDSIRSQIYFDKKYLIKKKIQNPKSINSLKDEIDKVDIVFVSEVKSELRNEIIKYCIYSNKEAYVTPLISDLLMASGKQVPGSSIPLYSISKAKPFPEYVFFKRFFDVVLSAIFIVILSPLMLVISVAIKLYDKGPAIYRQTRYTKDGKTFEIMKFRSMRVDAEKDGVARLTYKNDNRITPIGKIIRAIRFDELPQLINILHGQMSFVGPRPERPEICKQYEKEYPYFNLRLQAKAGLTGYAQVYGRYNTEPEDKLKMDLYYINNMSFMLDLKLMFMTIKTIFSKESTEAVNEGSTTALKKKNATRKTR